MEVAAAETTTEQAESLRENPKLHALVRVTADCSLPPGFEAMGDGFYFFEGENQKTMKEMLKDPSIIFLAMLRGRRLKIKEQRKIEFM